MDLMNKIDLITVKDELAECVRLAVIEEEKKYKENIFNIDPNLSRKNQLDICKAHLLRMQQPPDGEFSKAVLETFYRIINEKNLVEEYNLYYAARDHRIKKYGK